MRLPIGRFNSLLFFLSKQPKAQMMSATSALQQEETAREVFEEIHSNLNSGSEDASLSDMSRYYFDGRGKSVRPRLTATMAQAVNSELGILQGGNLYHRQLQISVVCEMYHTASLAHDDVIDRADIRRGKMSLNRRWGQKRSIWAGNYTVAIANKMLGQIQNDEATKVMMKILADLVLGELQQMSTKEKGQLDHYLVKSYNKTASLMEKSCKAVATLAAAKAAPSIGTNQKVIDNAASFGRNVGMAFQLVDDWLDFTASAEELGKPSGAADLRLGLATAPVLFAAEKHLELKPMILRKFSNPGDVEQAFDKVFDSDGLNETMNLAISYSQAAINSIRSWKDSSSKEVLEDMADSVVNRKS